MDKIVDFKEEGIAAIEDKIEDIAENVIEILDSEFFSDFLDSIEDEEQGNVYHVLVIDEYIDENFKNCSAAVQHIINKVHENVKNMLDLLKKRFLIKVMYGEIALWKSIKKDAPVTSVILFTGISDECDELTAIYLSKLFNNINEIDYAYIFNESEYGTYNTVQRKILKILNENPEIYGKPLIEKISKLKRKKN